MKKRIIKYAASLGIEKCGIAPYNEGCAIVCLFPYFCGNEKGNLSLYARGEDYHKIIFSKLSKLRNYINGISPLGAGEVFCDTGPHIDRRLAFLAGLGFFGKNQMLINDDFGSYFFIGWIECSLKLECDSPIKKSCLGCGKCVKSCPGGALSNGFNISRCASHISQKKGELSKEEEEILKKTPFVFGCDICQQVCPHNSGSAKAMAEFKREIKTSLSLSEIEALSNREFIKKYKNRAFSWRGKSVLIRNIKLKSDTVDGIERK